MDLFIIILVPAVLLPIIVIVALTFSQTGPWRKPSEPDRERLRQAREAYDLVQPAPAVPGPRPEPPLYKRGMGLPDGLAIYRDGIKAKFIFAPKCVYRYKPFALITAVYPATFERRNPVDKTMFSFTGLQIETADYEVALIDGINHELTQVLRLLETCLGPRWAECYHPATTLRTNDELGRHSILRGARVEAPPEAMTTPMIPQAGQSYGTGLDRGRGAILFEEPAESLQQRAKNLRIPAQTMLVFGVMFIGLGVFMGVVFHGITLLLPMTFFFSVMMFVMASMFFKFAKNEQPLIVYENGVLSCLPKTTTRVFVPYGQFVSISDFRDISSRQYYRLNAREPRYSVLLSKQLPAIEHFLPFIKSRLGNPQLDYPPVVIPTSAPVDRSKF